MQGPPPLPNLNQDNLSREVREVPPEVAKAFREIAPRAAEFVQRHQEDAAELARALKDSDDRSRELTEGNNRAAEEASKPVLDERAHRRPRAERRR